MILVFNNESKFYFYFFVLVFELFKEYFLFLILFEMFFIDWRMNLEIYLKDLRFKKKFNFEILIKIRTLVSRRFYIEFSLFF